MRKSYGNIPKLRVMRVIEALLVYAAEDRQGPLHQLCSGIRIRRIKKFNQIYVTTTLKPLTQLINCSERLVSKRYPEEMETSKVYEAISHLEKTVRVLTDLRTKRQGSKQLYFRLDLYHSLSLIQKNVEELERKWPRATPYENMTSENCNQVVPLPALKTSQEFHPLNFSAFLAEKRRYFTGREWLFSEMKLRFEVMNEQAILITGDPGSGKSSIGAEFIHRNSDAMLAYHCCHADTEQTIQPGIFVSSITAMIAARLSSYASLLKNPVYEDLLNHAMRDPTTAFEEVVLNLLHELPNPPKDLKYILVDGLEEASRSRNSGNPRSIVSLLAHRLQRFPSWIRVILLARPEPDILLRFSGLGTAEINAEDERNLQDITHYLDQRLQAPLLAAQLQSSRFPISEIKSHLTKVAKGNFLYIQQALEAIEVNRYSFDELNNLPPGLSGLYHSFFESCFPDPEDYKSVKRLLQVVAAAQEPLSAQQLAIVTGLALDDELYPLLSKLRAYLPPRPYKKSGIERYGFYHNSLKDWLTGRGTRGTTYYVSVLQGHRLLAETCIKLLPNPPRDWQEYLGQYAPHHLLQVGFNERLAEILVQYPSLSRSIGETIVATILDDPEWMDGHISSFLGHLAHLEEWTATATLLAIASNLLDCNRLQSAQQVADMLPSTHPYHQQVHLALALRQCVLESKTAEVIRLAGEVLNQENLISSLRGMAQFHLAEGLRVSGNFHLALRDYGEAVKILCPDADYTHWMQSQCALSDLEYVFGQLPSAWERLGKLQQYAETRHSLTFQAIIFRLRGQIFYILGDYFRSRDCFHQSLELFRQIKQPLRIVEALNSLAQAEIHLDPPQVQNLLAISRPLASDCEAHLELGKSYLIEAELMLQSGAFTEAENMAKNARGILSEVNYGVGVARSQILSSQALINSGMFNLAIPLALEAVQFLQREQIYPTLYLQVYDLLITATEQAKLESIPDWLNIPVQISNIENFPNMRDLIERYCAKHVKIVEVREWLHI